MLFLVDGNYYLVSACSAPLKVSLKSPSGEPTTGTYIFTTEIFNLLQKHKPTRLAVAWDSNAPTFRHKLYEGYKSGHHKMPEEVNIQKNRIQEILSAMNISMFSLPGYEADDIIGTITKQAMSQGIRPIYICSRDKDYLQLVNEDVLVLELKSGKFWASVDVWQDWGIWPEQFVDFLALQGDEADNVPGVPGIGAKTASKLLRESQSVEKLYCSYLWKVPLRHRNALMKSKDQVLLNKKLVTISTGLPIYVEFANLKWDGVNKEKLIKIFEELGFKKLLKRLEQF